jgi:hypothetical protein
MRFWIASAAALMMVAGCSASKEANAALEAMNLEAGNSSPLITYQGKSGSGDKITLNNVVISEQGGTGGGLKAKSLTFGGMNVTADGKPVVSSITLKGVTPEKPIEGVKLDLDTITVEGLNEVAGKYVAGAFTDAGPGEPPPFEQWEFSKVSINGMKVVGDFASMGAGAGTDAGKYNVQLGEFSVSGLKNKIFANTHMDGFKGDFEVPAEMAGGMPIAGTFDFGTADIANVQGGLFEQAIKVGMNSAFDPAAANNAEAEVLASLSSPIDPGYDNFKWSGMKVDASGLKINVSKTEQKVTRDAQGVVTKVSTPRTTFGIAADSAGGALGQQVTMALSMVGYPSSTVEFYGEGEATFDPAADLTRYANSNFGLTDSFDIKATGGVQGLKAAYADILKMFSEFETSFTGEAAIPDPDNPDAPVQPAVPAAPDMSALGKLLFTDLDITITDKTLVNFMLGVGGMFGGGDPETLRTDIVNMLSTSGTDLANSGVDPAVSNELSAALAQFVKQPGSLNIKLKPAAPVALFKEGEKLNKQQLGFSATFTPSPTPPPKPQ